ncbi:MAG: DUF1292 domain-containing protein [Oscillospiraceae bacterium]|nr:DUF1292 domain-containing protein [Oscillospiraceae bacterium]MBR0451010.1 DUF1292 domain-containing protein [Oscillospiraceae bacterium]MDO5136888.1 DUF1292 domain-containing protein [Oscillospiraceae bacterium]
MDKDRNANSEEMDFGPDYVTLTNEEGYEEQFELVDTVDVQGSTYVALLTASEDPEEYLNSDGSLIILKVTNEDGEEFLDDIQDDDEYEMIADLFTSRLADLYEIGDDEE